MRQRFGRDKVLDAALGIVMRDGYRFVTARRVANAAGCSAQPLYSRFGGMEGLMGALYERALEWVAAYNREHISDAETAFASNGLAHIRIAQEEPKLFEFLYLSRYMKAKSLDELLSRTAQPGVEEEISARYDLSPMAAHNLYIDMIVYTHGLASMLAVGASFSDKELKTRTDAAFESFLEHAGPRCVGKKKA
ncbi:MAG: TetR/AcrR family transcriptional regulator [Acidobacteriota bacterium]|nr:TetR/AcrR family transcriptional regulator [Acidobacteriota bacterium]